MTSCARREHMPPGGPPDLHRCVRDMLSLSALPAIWIDCDPLQIGTSLADALIAMLNLDFAYVALRGRPDEPPIEVIRPDDGGASDRMALISAAVAQWMESRPFHRKGQISDPNNGRIIRLASAPIGVGKDAMLVAGSQRADFPVNVDQALLAVGANQAAVAVQRWRAEQALRESEKRFQQFADNSTSVLWIMNSETSEVEYLSRAFEHVWGALPGDMLQDRRQWPIFVHSDDRARAISTLGGVRHGDVVVQEYRIVRPDGTVRWVRDTGFPIRDEQGRVRRVAGIAQDLTRAEIVLVYLVEPDDTARQALSSLLRGAGYETKEFASARAFLQVAPALAPGCVLFSVRTPEAASLAALNELKVRRNHLPVVVTGHCSSDDVALAVRAMKAGAVDFLKLPQERETLLTTIASALADIREAGERDRAAERARASIAQMTARERKVLDGLLGGGTNKTIAKDLGISPRTVEAHRARIMERLGARTLPEAVLIAADAGLRPGKESQLIPVPSEPLRDGAHG